MVIPLPAERHGDDVRVTDLPELNGWTATVHADGSITLTPAPGERITQPAWRRVPVGAVITAADTLTHDDRVTRLVLAAPALSLDDRIPGERRVAMVARWHREAVAAGLTPRAVVAALYGVGEQKAGAWITEARAAGAIADGSDR